MELRQSLIIDVDEPVAITFIEERIKHEGTKTRSGVWCWRPIRDGYHFFIPADEIRYAWKPNPSNSRKPLRAFVFNLCYTERHRKMTMVDRHP